MNISCPSCGVVHDSQDYPNAFEIHCVCGYSLLVPSEAPAKEKTITSFEKAAPSALDAEDEAIIIRPDGLLAMNPAEVEVPASSGGVLQMTPSEQLPPGMVYDSFELPPDPNEKKVQPETESVDLGNADMFSDGSREWVLGDGLSQAPTDTRDPLAPVESPVQSKSVERERENAKASRAQILVQRVQMSSMEQFLGKSYRLNLGDVDAERSEQILAVVNRMLRERPWLEAECRRRGIDFPKEIAAGALAHVPELVALEIYLCAFEAGADCQFEPEA